MESFGLHAAYSPMGDQPQAIDKLVRGVQDGLTHQVLLGVTGSGKTYTIANLIEQIQKPVLVISHNKTLAAQLYQEYRDFFPKNAVEYFVSYYDFYQPEAYIPQSDTYIEKDAAINEDIDRLRLSATTSLLTRESVIVVASVSCIYNLGSPVEYMRQVLRLKQGMPVRREDIITRLLDLFYTRNDFEFTRGTFRVKGDQIDIFPAYLEIGVRIDMLGNQVQSISLFEPVTGKRVDMSAESSKSQSDLARLVQMVAYGELALYPAKHYVAPEERREQSLKDIQNDLQIRLEELRGENKMVEAYRLEQKTNYDLELIQTLGYCKGIENYSRYFDGRKPGEPPYSLLDYFTLAREDTGGDYVVIIDESHITIPQINGMFNGDQARKKNLIDYGFRLPSALDNRPLRFDEFLARAPQIIYTSATPGEWEVTEALKSAKKVWFNTEKSSYDAPPEEDPDVHTGVVEQLIRPTGILDPVIEIRGTDQQIDNLLVEIKQRVAKEQRVLITTLTKRMAEDLAEFLQGQGLKVEYLHADVETLDRSDILDNLRKGVFDVLVGINLLREGLDLPEVSLVAILEADKEGFLRSETSLVQTMGRAARHIEGKVIMYADTVTGSMKRSIDEIDRRREIQRKYNEEHNIEPVQIVKPIRERLIAKHEDEDTSSVRYSREVDDLLEVNDKASTDQLVAKLEQEMKRAAKTLDFEKAAFIRDRIEEVKVNSKQ